MLLWDCDDRTYGYYIEVSTNQRDWTTVCDRSRSLCRSWQVVTFKRRPVVFIRIVGTRNSANEVREWEGSEDGGGGGDEVYWTDGVGGAS